MARWIHCILLFACTLGFMALSVISANAKTASEDVILLHGLCRTSRSMEAMQTALSQAGYNVHNIDYPSRSTNIETLAETVIGPVVEQCRKNGATKINFVTHSLGGILVRSYLARHDLPQLGRVIMLAPPNQGSELVDRLGGWWVFKKINGPAGNELGTAPSSLPNRLGPANYCVGVIAGSRTINWINSLLIPGTDDGKVSLKRTQLAGMTDYLIIPATHPFIMRNRTAIRQTICFLQKGSFDH